MNEIKDRIDQFVEQFKQDRDEMRLQLHLAKEDMSDEWEKLETKIAHLESKARELGSATAEASKDIGAAAKLLAEEIRGGFNTIRKHL